LRCNPGGEVIGRSLAQAATAYVGGEWVVRVLTWGECEAFEREMKERGLSPFDEEII
jgi:hypothetical protein